MRIFLINQLVDTVLNNICIIDNVSYFESVVHDFQQFSLQGKVE